MDVLLWNQDGIIALIPLDNPGDGEAEETFDVLIKDGAGSIQFQTTEEVLVVGPAGNYPDPPSHTPTYLQQFAIFQRLEALAAQYQG